MFGYIYKITNKLNNAVYIGKRELDHFDESYWGSGKYLCNAINKYGLTNFTRVLIDKAETKEELSLKEKFWIAFARTNYEYCYNIADGGQGGAIKNKKELFPDWCRKISVSYKKKFEDSSYRQWRIENTRKVYNNKTRINKDGVIKNVDNDLLDTYLSDGWNVGGGTRDLSACTNISNGKRGTICVNKDGKNKYIKPDNVDEYISNGWSIGKDDTNTNYTNRHRIHIYKGTTVRQVLENDLPNYLSDGWKLGEPKNSNKGQGTKDKKYITDGTVNILVNKSDIQTYLDKGYRLGLTRKNKN